MGDMKTPDFDDLLAAFDIPDMVDPKAAIESGHHEDHEGSLKQSSGVTMNGDETHNPPLANDIGVSVIVKNIRNSDLVPGGNKSDREGSLNSHLHPNTVGTSNGHNNFLQDAQPGTNYNKKKWKPSSEGGESGTNQMATFNQFSPISSAEEFEDDDKIEVDDSMDNSVCQTETRSTTTGENQNLKSPTSVDKISKTSTNEDQKLDRNNNSSGGKLQESTSNYMCQSGPPREELQDSVTKPQSDESKHTPSVSQIKTKSSVKLSSCIAAIAALSAKKVTDIDVSDPPTTQKRSVKATENGKAPETQQECESALEFAKRLLTKQQGSPSSVTSEGSSTESPTSSVDTTPVIPKVRIKTIKTSSGQIKRTVTRVIPEFNTETLKKGNKSPSGGSTATSIFSSPTRASLPTTVVTTAGGPSIEITKQMTIKPVATAFLPVSAVKTAGSQVINLKLANNTTVKATVIPAATVQSASSAILKGTNVIQPQTVMVPASSLASAKLMPKTVHLSNLNLLPSAMASAVSELQQTLSSSKQSNQQSQNVKSQTSKKVPRVQVFTSSQSSVVDAFNKVLSSINPVPVYIPNLSPPTSACITLPSHGYKCLECGDSFALEKSLTQHYERRSVRIEVTCNHCAKSLAFYNKCSLLSHARGHKDKGVVMQCSHLILKPIPTEQMITALSSSPPNVSPAQAPASPMHGKTVSDSQPPAVPVSCSAPITVAFPPEDDASKLCRLSLKCLECNELFQDDSALVIHYQQAQETSGQVRVWIYSLGSATKWLLFPVQIFLEFKERYQGFTLIQCNLSNSDNDCL